MLAGKASIAVRIDEHGGTPWTQENISEIERGGYFIKHSPDSTINLIATGSEVDTVLEAAKILEESGTKTNIVSVPCLEELEKDKSIYQKIFSQNTTNIVVECSHPNSWYRHTDKVIGIDTFGESGKGNDLMEHFGFTPSKVAKKILQLI